MTYVLIMYAEWKIVGAIAMSPKPTIATGVHIMPGTFLGFEPNAALDFPRRAMSKTPRGEMQYNQFGMSNGGMMPCEFSNQAADGWHAGDDGCCNGHELTADQIESFFPLNPFTCDPIVQFSDSHERGVLCPLLLYFSGCLGGTYDPVLFDGAPAYCWYS